mmetsp:Transcript_20833/g.51086  ORF Transcript_20833/g.51086 Transcript_20833/m.51086 type:complete len:231 (-) Transcript_20833:272-964(-)
MAVSLEGSLPKPGWDHQVEGDRVPRPQLARRHPRRARQSTNAGSQSREGEGVPKHARRLRECVDQSHERDRADPGQQGCGEGGVGENVSHGAHTVEMPSKARALRVAPAVSPHSAAAASPPEAFAIPAIDPRKTETLRRERTILRGSYEPFDNVGSHSLQTLGNSPPEFCAFLETLLFIRVRGVAAFHSRRPGHIRRVLDPMHPVPPQCAEMSPLSSQRKTSDTLRSKRS